MMGADARPKGRQACQPRQQVGTLARAGGLLYWTGKCQVRLRAQASSLIPGGSGPRGHIVAAAQLGASSGLGCPLTRRQLSILDWLTNRLSGC